MSNNPDHKSLLAQALEALPPGLLEYLRPFRTAKGGTIEHVIRSGMDYPESGVGAYAPDAEAYELFGDILRPIISKYHNVDALTVRQITDFDVSKIPTEPIDPTGQAIVSTRVRVGRNLKGFAFAPAISKRDRLKVMHKMAAAVLDLSGDLEGDFYQLEGMSEEVREKLVNDHFLFKQGDRFLESAGANRDWPNGRGIFHNREKTALVWANEEDHLRIISMEMGGDLRSVFGRLAHMVEHLSKTMEFAMHPRYGALSSCPTNLGTAMRASVHVKLPNLSKKENEAEFGALAAELGLSIRGVNGEHSESVGGVCDISNKQRLGISEVDSALVMFNGVKRILAEERRLAA